MSVRKVSTASILSPSYKNSKIWDGESFPGYYEAIATAVVDSNEASSITFSNIPQNYKHLQIRGICRSTRSDFADGIAMTFNSDSTSAYSWHYYRGDGSGPSAGAGTNQSNILVSYDLTSASAPANDFGAFIIDILDYTSSNYKTSRHFVGNDRNGSGAVGIASGNWRNSSTISSITLAPYWGAFNWVLYSHFALYGVRG